MYYQRYYTVNDTCDIAATGIPQIKDINIVKQTSKFFLLLILLLILYASTAYLVFYCYH